MHHGDNLTEVCAMTGQGGERNVGGSSRLLARHAAGP